MITFDDVIKAGFGIMAGYIIGQAIVFREVDAVDYWDAKGYIEGIIRGARDRATAIQNLDTWRDYWLREKPYMSYMINELYRVGQNYIRYVYG